MKLGDVAPGLLLISQTAAVPDRFGDVVRKRGSRPGYGRHQRNTMEAIRLESEITCPQCGQRTRERMPEDS